MGKIGTCCCNEDACCLCDPAWDYETWSVTVLGKTFSGTFSPGTKPDPLTVENGCQSRQGDDCIIDNPTTLLDCVQESSWGSRQFVGMGVSGICIADCPQCFCLDPTAMQDDEACLKEGLVHWETEIKGVTHSRAWQQEAFYGVAQMLCCDSPANSVKFIFDLYYHVARFAAVSEQGFRRFRSLTYDCIYAPGENVTDPTSTYVYGSWVEPVPVGSKPPCIPCDWDQSDFFGQCPTLESPCEPCPSPSGCEDEIVDYTVEWSAIICIPIGFTDADEDLICPIPDVGDDDFRFIYYGESTLNAYVGSQTNYCGEALNSFGGNCLISPMSAVIEHRFSSDCIPCDELGCTVTLNRITGDSLGSSISQCVFNADNDCDCGTISQLCKTIPASITMTLAPC